MGLDNLTALWTRVRDSLWFFPGALTLGAVLLSVITIQLDVMDVLPIAPAGLWLFSGSAEGARGVLTAIASGLITVTGVVFSVTIVAIQLASTQFTPRILRNFTSDRANQLVLGIFIGTFTYALLILRTVRGAEEAAGAPAGEVTPGDVAAGTGFVPNLSVTVAVALTLVSVGFLIFFIDHAARSVQASVIIDRVTRETRDTITRLLPDAVGEPRDDDVAAVTPDAAGTVVAAQTSGYLQGVDQDALFDLVADADVTLRMDAHVGDFLMPGSALATVWPGGLQPDEPLAHDIRDAFVTGPQRTPHLDVELGLIELVDIAVKALSPGINDPTTATLCVDRLTEVLRAFASRTPPGRVRRQPDGGGVLILPRPRFDDLVRVAFDQIRHFGVGNPRFAVTLLDRLGDLGTLVPHDHRPPLAREAAAILRTASQQIHEPSDRHRVEAAGQRALRQIGIDAP